MNAIDYKRLPLKKNSLQMLRQLGVNFGCVFDVGVNGQTPELIEVFPDLKHYLFEPVEQYIPTIKYNYAKIDHEILNVAVSDRDGMGELKLVKLAADYVTHSKVVEDGMPPPTATEDVVPIKLLRLSTLLAERSFPEPILLKIDVDGHEPAILNGLIGAQAKIGAVVVESGPHDFIGRLRALTDMGFILWDLVDPCYYKGCLAQMDLVLVSPQISAQANLQPLSRPGAFDRSAWHCF
jgi:FkbM family methyltransferase